MNIAQLKALITSNFAFTPTDDQQNLIASLSEFLLSREHHPLFVLKGYAGTGKTTSINALVKSLPGLHLKSVLLAPTGRAAKVITNYTSQAAFTIHKKIYKLKASREGGARFVLQPNLHKNTIFIVDEASMIGDQSLEGGNSLLDDLIRFVYSGSGCGLILIGDDAQLPPVGLDYSPALNLEFLHQAFPVTIFHSTLREVMRQQADSGILYNATKLRYELLQKEENVKPQFEIKRYKDLKKLEGLDLEDALASSYSNFGVEGTMVICRSNKRANIFNQQIRTRIRWQESEISNGDYLMVVKNNYFWLPEESKAGFIANGDTVIIKRIRAYKELYGFRFAEVTLQLADYPEESDLDTVIMLDTLMAESPALTMPQSRAFFEAVMQDYADEPDRRKRIEMVKQNRYFNALQVKFAYAVTCHKAQGGQWEQVFIEQGYLTDEMLNKEFLRWLYTAVTRATQKVFLVNFKEEFFIG